MEEAVCAAQCGRPFEDGTILNALDRKWHRECFVCAVRHSRFTLFRCVNPTLVFRSAASSWPTRMPFTRRPVRRTARTTCTLCTIPFAPAATSPSRLTSLFAIATASTTRITLPAPCARRSWQGRPFTRTTTSRTAQSTTLSTFAAPASRAASPSLATCPRTPSSSARSTSRAWRASWRPRPRTLTARRT